MCEHLHAVVYWRLYAMETREEPAEYEGRAECTDCGKVMSPEDLPEECERDEQYV